MADLIETKYQAEIKQSEIDHHTPTAGAMCGHIISNLWLLDIKWHQSKWYLKGNLAPVFTQIYQKLNNEAQQQIDTLGYLLRDEAEIVPATMQEFNQYTQIKEDPRIKYYDAKDILKTTVTDLLMADLFITRAIKLAEKEDKPALQNYLTQMLGGNLHHIRQFENVVGEIKLE